MQALYAGRKPRFDPHIRGQRTAELPPSTKLEVVPEYKWRWFQNQENKMKPQTNKQKKTAIRAVRSRSRVEGADLP